MMNRHPHVVITAGGTAGHIEPALNLADALREREPAIEVSFLGGERGLEGTLVPARGYELLTVASAPMPRKISVELLKVGPRVRSAALQAAEHLRVCSADVVVGFGGYASVPGYLAGRRLGIPVVVHEANARAGLANRLASRFTPYVFTSVPGSIKGARLVGLPLRPVIARLDRSSQRSQALINMSLDPNRLVLLVFGGSQGSLRLNAAIAAALPQLLAQGIQVIHAFGPRNDAPVPMPGYLPVAYIDRMDQAYAGADLAVTRAGAMTCAELAAVGLPAIYVPLPIGNGEQRLNAGPVVAAGGGILIEDAQLTGPLLAQMSLAILGDEGQRVRMGRAASAHGAPEAGSHLSEFVYGIGEYHLTKNGRG